MKVFWDTFRWGIVASFDEMRVFLDTVEQQLEEAKHLQRFNIESCFQNPVIAEDEDHARQLWAEYDVQIGEHRRQFESTYPRILRYGFVTQLFMLIECNLRVVCDEIATRHKLALRVRDLRGSLFEQAKTFLGKVALINFAETERWAAMQDFQKVRDCIVHASGRVADSRDKDRLRKLMREGNGLEGPDSEGRLLVNRAYCIHTLAEVQVFFSEVFDVAGFNSAEPRFES